VSNTGKLRIGVIFGGRSGEHEVSLMSARSILDALNPDKYMVIQIGITHDGAWFTGKNVLEALISGRTGELEPAVIFPEPTHPGLFTTHESDHGILLDLLSTFDVLFPVLHGTFGEDGTIQGLFEMAGVAYVGAGVLGSSLGMDKGIFKDVMRANGIPVVNSIIVLRSQINHSMDIVLNQAEKISTYPLFTKPANLGSSVGITKCANRSDLMEGLLDAARFDRRILIEQGINAREIEVSVLGNDAPVASVCGEVIPSREFYSYEAKYIDNNSELLIPAPIGADIAEEIQRFAVRAFKSVDGAGMARADFLLDKVTDEIYLNEINTIPGFTQISMYPKLWTASGLPYPALVDKLIELALERKEDRDHTEWRYNR
jgi:D-alanine-D-alanine ligase